MYKYILLLLFVGFTASAQELNCNVKVSYDRITDANPQIFKTLEKSLQDFVNNTKFTTRNFARNERIECSMFINLSAYNSNNFSASLQVQARRPVYGSTYFSPIFNFNDKDVSFRYIEGENLTYNPNTFDSNLMSLVGFYANMIIGLDADTFALEGGTPYYEAAQGIVNVAQGQGNIGWSQQDGNQSRYFLVNDIMSNTFAPFRKAMYEYHIGALDKMAENQKTGKEKTIVAINTLAELYKVRPNAFITRIFFDAKSDEIATIFSGGPQVDISKLVDTLNRISPLNATKWAKIK
ncbi:hypothetical protein AM493_19810 [Flavobacterium akiainvivens]|uniref:DUF4835 domain-containing protein n=1 Tax=Flavobacterium akiainvivens TaxID=1202724 RepID=A0A0M9VJS2_9FLAO|nr:DUF4835 family protein [Flavobacterium akiainvivens]KOS08046.1 hypothetical protein AM493_19810 [Flavobacterium akiainvivens]SFQ62305.1 protein of unknown function [Flavobacterium akiainvivens]